MKNLIIELDSKEHHEISKLVDQLQRSALIEIDMNYKPVPIRRRKNKSDGPAVTYVIRGKASEKAIEKLSAFPFVFKVWNDTPIAHHGCGCSPTKKGNLDSIAECIGAKQLWDKGFRGDGIVIGIVDVGVDQTQFPVIGGSSPNWGFVAPTATGSALHGNMSATDALAIAPSARIFDMNYTINTGGTIQGVISAAIQAYRWAVQEHAISGTPHILSNSWGIYQEDWDADYATNPLHPFTLIVEEVLDLGIKVLFSAGNCGRPCKLSKCGDDTGGGRDIWGANGHPEVMTVGAVKLNNKRLKYSSQGPAALSDAKPDFCGYSNFRGYYHGIDGNADTGTSAACPVVAGAVALLLNYDPGLTQEQIKDLLQQTSKDLESFGFDNNTGHGVVRVDNAYYELEPQQRPAQDFRDRLCDYVYNVNRNCVQWADEGSLQCSTWADEGSNQCTIWADEGSSQCQNWADQGSNNCCTWWPCSWGCKLFYWVANWVCQAWYWVANLVCKAWYWVAKWVCKAWYWVAKIVCKLYVWVITSITFTNCKCR